MAERLVGPDRDVADICLLTWDTDKGESRLKKISSRLPIRISSYGLAFGNEVADSRDWLYVRTPDIVPEVTGYSIWRQHSLDPGPLPGAFGPATHN